MSNDESREEFVVALWLRAIGCCDECGYFLPTDAPIESVFDEDSLKWARHVAELALRDGWVMKGDKLLCAKCARRTDRPPPSKTES